MQQWRGGRQPLLQQHQLDSGFRGGGCPPTPVQEIAHDAFQTLAMNRRLVMQPSGWRETREQAKTWTTNGAWPWFASSFWRASLPKDGPKLDSTVANELALAGGAMHLGAAMDDSIKELTAEICAFREARDWMQFHAPKELAVAIAAEAGELLQHFVWQSAEQSRQRVCERREEIAGEIADVGILLFELAANLDLSLSDAMRAKLAKNALRYPVDKARGSNKKYDEL
jgi:dCTP diphosphatase